MSEFSATTASNGPLLKDPRGAEEVLDRYNWDGELTVAVEYERPDGLPHLEIYGYAWPEVWGIPEGVRPDHYERDYDADPAEGLLAFLRALAPYLAEPLTIQAVGAEECLFPLAACEWHVEPGSTEVEVRCLYRHAESSYETPLFQEVRA